MDQRFVGEMGAFDEHLIEMTLAMVERTMTTAATAVERNLLKLAKEPRQ